MDIKVSRPYSQSFKYRASERKGDRKAKTTIHWRGHPFKYAPVLGLCRVWLFYPVGTQELSLHKSKPCSKIEGRPRGTELGLLEERTGCFEFLLSLGYIESCPNGQWYLWYHAWKSQQFPHPAPNLSLCSIGVCHWWQCEMTVSSQTLHLESILCFRDTL